MAGPGGDQGDTRQDPPIWLTGNQRHMEGSKPQGVCA